MESIVLSFKLVIILTYKYIRLDKVYERNWYQIYTNVWNLSTWYFIVKYQNILITFSPIGAQCKYIDLHMSYSKEKGPLIQETFSKLTY